MTYFKTQVPYYIGGIKQVVPGGYCSLQKLSDSIGNPSPKQIALMGKIRTAANTGHEKTKAKLKAQLPFFTPAIHCTYRNYQNITRFTALMPLDFDKLPSAEFAHELKQELFDSVDSIILAWMSSSGKGVRCIMRIPEAKTVEEYKSYFKGFEQKLAGDLLGFDPAPQNPVLPMFTSIDRAVLVRKNAGVWTEQYEPPPEVVTKPKRFIHYDRGDQSRKVVRFVRRKLSTIADAGHPILRATAYTVGGYVGDGCISHNDALRLLETEIDNHTYLRKKAATYKKTAAHMIKKGMNQPLKLNAYER